MRGELANLNHCAVRFLSRAAVNLCWYYYTTYINIKIGTMRLLYCMQTNLQINLLLI